MQGGLKGVVTLNSQGLGSFQDMGTPSRGVMSGKRRHMGSKECVPMDFSGGHGHSYLNFTSGVLLLPPQLIGQ